jgi:hypothetical protein
LIGIEQGIFSINSNNGTIINQIMDTTYIQCIEEMTWSSIFILEEYEFLVFSCNGYFLWRKIFPDIIEYIKEKKVTLRFMIFQKILIY